MGCHLLVYRDLQPLAASIIALPNISCHADFLAARAGALDPQQASSASEELKTALLQQGVMQALTELASDCAERVSAAPKGDAARYAILWKEHMLKHPPHLQGMVDFPIHTSGAMHIICLMQPSSQASYCQSMITCRTICAVPIPLGSLEKHPLMNLSLSAISN